MIAPIVHDDSKNDPFAESVKDFDAEKWFLPCVVNNIAHINAQGKYIGFVNVMLKSHF